MNYLKESFRGVFISVFAMVTVLILTVMISFMSERVTNFLTNQSDSFSTKNVYWLSFSGMEVLANNRFAEQIIGPTNYIFSSGKFQASGSQSGIHNGMNKTNSVTSVGSDGYGLFSIKWVVTNPDNYALSFDGSNDYVDIGNVFDGIKTISCWIRADDITSNIDNIVDLNGSDYIRVVNGEVVANNIDSPTYYIDATIGEQTLSSTNVWYHMVVTTSTGINISDMDIGRIEGDINYMNGLIDQVSVWSVTLNTNQIRSLFIQGRNFDVSNFLSGDLKGYWPFENNVDDASENSKNGVNNGATSTGT
tara:strand:+ start:15949 stop:16866 length:918 start_codon:yes stop_codon:yes gene_type:complete